MDNLNYTFDTIIKNKNDEIDGLFNIKNEKMIKKTNPEDINKVNFCVSSTISKINNELDRKLKSSKSYKNKQEIYANNTL